MRNMIKSTEYSPNDSSYMPIACTVYKPSKKVRLASALNLRLNGKRRINAMIKNHRQGTASHTLYA